MDNKAPGTTPRPQGYETAGGGQSHENFFHPRPKMKRSVQRAGLRISKRVVYISVWGTALFLGIPMVLGPLWENYIARSEWVQRAQRAAKGIWTRRNEKDWDVYMTQRQNSWWEFLGLKRYNIGGDDNWNDEIQKYK